MLAAVRILVARGARFPNSKRPAFQLWRWLSSWNVADAAEAILSTQPNVLIRNNVGDTPLHFAATKNANHIIVCLVNYGAYPSAVNVAGLTPLLISASLRDEVSLSALCGVADPTALKICNPRGYTPRALFSGGAALQKSSAPFHGITATGEASLVCAVRANDAELVATLCAVLRDELSEKDAQNCLSDTLWLAVCLNRTECLHALLTVHRPERFSLDTLLCLAAEKADVFMVEALLHHDESLSGAAEVNGVTARAFAARRGDEEGQRIVELLSLGESGASSDIESVAESYAREEVAVASVVKAYVQERTNQLLVRCTASADATDSSEFFAQQAQAEVRRIGELQGLGKQYIFAHFLPCGRAGQGAFGEVTLALFGRRRVVFKIEKRSYSGSTEMDCNRMVHFAREAKTLRVLQEPTHPNCVSFLGIAVDPDVGVAIVTEFVSGGSLGEWLYKRGDLTAAATRLELAAGVAAGLVFVHETGITHGDIKPDNILLEYEIDEGTGEPTGVMFPKIIDFGGSCPYWKGRTAYTELYAPPEVSGEDFTVAQSDVYSLACVVYEILSGQRVSQERKENVVLTPVGLIVGDDARAAVEDVLPAELKEVGVSHVLCGCWKPEPQNRPRALEVYDRLITLLRDVDEGLAAGVQNRANSGPDVGNSPLMAAVQYGDAERVTTLLERGLRPDEKNLFGHTPLHVAAAVDDAEVLQMLLSYNPQLLQDKFGTSPPELSANADVSEVFLEYEEAHSACGAPEAKTRSYAELYPIHDAIERGDVGRLTALITNGHSNPRDNRGRTILELAAKSSSMRMFSCVVDNLTNASVRTWVAVLNAVWHSPPFVAVAVCKYLSKYPTTQSLVLGSKREAEWLPAKCGGLNSVSKMFAWVRLWKVALFAAEQLDDGCMYGRLFSLVESVDVTDGLEATALICAAHGGKLELVELLLERGASVTATCSGMTALEYALDGGHEAIFRHLVEAGSQMRSETDSGVSYLELAFGSGSRAIIEAVVDNFNVHDVFRNGETALHAACQSSDARLVELLLEAGADPETVAAGKTALAVAVEKNSTSVVKILLDRGASIDTATPEGMNLLKQAFVRGSSSLACVLASRVCVDTTTPDGKTAFTVAVEQGCTASAQVLINRGADVNARSADGKTMLMIAAEKGHGGLTRVLVDNGAEVDEVAPDGKTALMFASIARSPPVVRALVDGGATVDSATADGKTALMFAAENEHRFPAFMHGYAAADFGYWAAHLHSTLVPHSSVVRILVDSGANVNLATAGGKTALMFAAESDSRSIVGSSGATVGISSATEVIVDWGVNLDVVTADGKTALMFAASSGSIYSLRILLEAGADAAAVANDGSTALSIANAAGHRDVAALLHRAHGHTPTFTYFRI